MNFLAITCLLLSPLWTTHAATHSSYEVTGDVLDHEGKSVEGVSVWLSQDRRIQVATTDARGRFQFDEVLVGPIEVVALKKGHSVGGLQGQIIGSVHIAVNLYEPESISVRVIDPDNRPIPGARVKSLYVSDSFPVSVEDLVQYGFPSFRSDENGFIRIDIVPAGSQASFSIAHRRYAEQRLPTLPVGADLDVRLPYGVKLRGRVSNQAGQALPRTRISIHRGQREFTEVLTDPEGFYAAIVPHGQYYVTARRIDYAIPDPVQVHWNPDEDSAVLDITLLPPHVISGTVVDLDEKPVPGTKIAYVARDLLFAEVLSDTEGDFSLVVSSGDGRLQVSPPQRMITVDDPTIVIQGLKDAPFIELHPIKLKPLPTIKGKVSLKDDESLGKILVSTVGIRPARRVLTNPDGSFELELDEMPQGGRLVLRAEHGLRFLRRETKLNVTKLEEAELRLRPFKPNLDKPLAYNSNKIEAMIGKPAPEILCDTWFNLAETQNATEGIRLSDFMGKVVVLNFWGGWDDKEFSEGPNRLDELNHLQRIFQDAGDVVFINIHDASSTAEEVRQYVKQFKIPFLVGRDTDPTLTFDAYNVNMIPQTVIVDRQGILRHYKVQGRLLELIKDVRRKN